MTPAAGTHVVHEADPWSENVGDHPERADSPTYSKSRALMVEIAKLSAPWGPPPWQDHHSGCLPVWNGTEWFWVRNLAGIEWSMQFACDPAKVEKLRLNALKLYAAFPATLDQFDKMGHTEQRAILATEITTAEQVGVWTDSIFNASMPLPQGVHIGTIKPGANGADLIAGIHHYPLPVWDGQFVKFDDYVLWVTDEDGQPAAVAPVSQRGSGDGRVRVVHATPGTALHAAHQSTTGAGADHILEADHSLAQQAFAQQALAPKP